MRFDTRTEKWLAIVRRLSSLLSLRRRNRVKAIVASDICFVLFYDYFFPHQPHRVSVFKVRRPKQYINELVCPQYPIKDDILVVLRTGATGALEKLPVHLETTL
jgi:hypothetical protein